VVPGTTTQETVGSRTLTVIAEAAAPAGVRITKPETLAADVTVTVAPPAADQPVSGGQFRLGQEADDRTVVDITVTAVPPGGLEVCLPVTAALRREAGGAALLLLHYDGSRWTVVAESRDLGTRVCAPGVTDFSPFAVGYVRRAVVPVNSTPRFPDAAAVDLPIFTQGTAIAPVTLPGATGGVGALTYTLTGPDGADLPPGLSYTHPTAEDAHGGTLSGTPTEAQEPTPYTLTAMDRNGDSVDLEFSLEVTADVMPMFRDDAAVADQDYVIGVAIPPLRFPPVEAGNAPLTYTLVGPEGADLPAGLHYTPPEAEDAHGGVLRGTPREVAAAGRYTLTVTDADGGSVELSFRLVVAADSVPTFGERTMTDRQYPVGSPIPVVTFPPAKEGNGRLTYTLTGPNGADPPPGLSYTRPTAEDAHGGTLSGTPTEARPPIPYTLTATDMDGDSATLEFMVAIILVKARVTIADATAVEGAPVTFQVTLSRALAAPLTVQWTAGVPGTATPGDDYEAVVGRLVIDAGETAGALSVQTADDRRVEPSETFTVGIALSEETVAEVAKVTATGTIEDDDTARARRRSLGMVLAGVGRTLATDAVDVIGSRFVRRPTSRQVTVGGQALGLDRDAQTGRWRQSVGVAYGVARALGVEVGSPLAGGDSRFGQIRGAAWSSLTRHLNDPHAAAAPLSAWDTPGAFAAPVGMGPDGPSDAHSIPPPAGRRPGGGPSAWESPAGNIPFESGRLSGWARYGHGLGQGGFGRAHAATPQALTMGSFRAPVRFRRVSGAEVLSQSAFEIPLSRPTPSSEAPTTVGMTDADPATPVETAAQTEAAAWTLWGRGTASGFDGRPKDDFSMDGNVFTGYLGVDYRLQPNVLLGLAVAHSQSDVDYETTDVTKGDVGITLTSILPYAHWSPRPGLGMWGLFGAGWGDLQLRDEAGKVQTDLEMLLGAVGARQEVLTWRRIDVALKADAFLTELEAGSDDRLPETAGDAQRLRLMVEGRTAWVLSEDSHLTPVFEIGGRWDGGKAETGVGAEMGGGFEYAHTKLGLGIEARGRYLLAHQKSAFDEWGASLTLRLDPGADKRGLWLALAPIWGAEASQVEQLWGSADVLRATGETDTPPSFSPAQVEFDVGYGMVTHEGAGLLTTYGGLSMLGPDRRGVRLGGRLALSEWIDLSVEGERTTQGGAAEHQVALYGYLGW